MARLIGALILSFTLAVPYLAEAACAWVLWNEVAQIGLAPEPSSFWVLIQASPVYEECEQGRMGKAKDLLRVTETDRSGPNVARVTAKADGNIITKTTHLKDGRVYSIMNRLTCLPDTIDPRGLKGGQ